MSINAGQAVTAANVNAAFLSRTANSSTTGQIALNNPATDAIPELQAFLNHLIEVLGLISYNADLTFDTPVYLTNGMSVTEALDQLDLELANIQAAFSGIYASNNVWTGNQKFNGTVDYGFFNDSTTVGADQVLAVPDKIIVRLQGAVTSVSGIESPAATRMMILINDTSGAVVLKDFDTVNAAAGEYIRTGVNNDITMQDQSSLLLVYDETSAVWQVVGGSGSGGSGGGSGMSVNFRAPSGDGALLNEDSDLPVFTFESGKLQRIVSLVQVPDSYNPGFQPYIRIPSYSAGSTNHAYIVKSTLIKPTLQAPSSTTNVRTTASDDYGLAGAGILEKRDVFISSVAGEINSVAILAGDYIKIEIIRTTASGTETTDDSNVLHESIGVFFA